MEDIQKWGRVTETSQENSTDAAQHLRDTVSELTILKDELKQLKLTSIATINTQRTRSRSPTPNRVSFALPMNKGQKFICARSAIDSSQSIAACKLLNPTNQVIWLPRHKALGILEPIHSQTLAVMTPSVTSHTDMNTTPTAQPLHSKRTTSTHTNHTTQRPPSLEELGVIYQSDSLSAEENSRLKDLLQANINVFSASISDLQSTPYIQHSIDTGNA